MDSNSTQHIQKKSIWKPITALPEALFNSVPHEFNYVVSQWLELIEAMTADDYLKSEIMNKLDREWAIETGNADGIYFIEKRDTENLIESGISAKIISQSDFCISPEEKVDIINDHLKVLDNVIDYISNTRELSTDYIKELHSTLCAHQVYRNGNDPSGRELNNRFFNGEYKKQPNDPMTLDGITQRYCAPEQTATEMERLIELNLMLEVQDVSPIVHAAWLHHSYTQIHPFQVGNGRVVRLLASMVLLKGNLPHFIVKPETRYDYINALEAADSGNLKKLIEFICSSIKSTVLKAEYYYNRYLLTSNVKAREDKLLLYRFAKYLSVNLYTDLKVKMDELASDLLEAFASTDVIVSIYEKDENEIPTIIPNKQITTPKPILSLISQQCIGDTNCVLRRNEIVRLTKRYNAKTLISTNVMLSYDKVIELIMLYVDSFVNDTPMLEIYFIVNTNNTSYKLLLESTIVIESEDSITNAIDLFTSAKTGFIKEANLLFNV